MSRSKLIVIGLIVIGLLFFVALGFGYGNRNSGATTEREYAEQGQFPNWAVGMADVLAPFSPKVQLETAAVIFKSGDVLNFAPNRLPGSTFTIPPSDRPFRVATFERQAGQFRLEYQDRTDAAERLDLQEQSLEIPTEQGRDRASLVAMQAGGTLQIWCEGAIACQLSLR
ncbi:hypothetical protein ACQ4M4_12140 [Leptolyngbya sp. AN02str]|uniref:hypothetical protein n=1 Tax=Leptolyngbya sp. AN02str TaxID=3423363 RepID=UPI003D323B52